MSSLTVNSFINPNKADLRLKQEVNLIGRGGAQTWDHAARVPVNEVASDLDRLQLQGHRPYLALTRGLLA